MNAAKCQKKESSEIVNFFNNLAKCHVPMVGHMLFFWIKIGSSKREGWVLFERVDRIGRGSRGSE